MAGKSFSCRKQLHPGVCGWVSLLVCAGLLTTAIASEQPTSALQAKAASMLQASKAAAMLQASKAAAGGMLKSKATGAFHISSADIKTVELFLLAEYDDGLSVPSKRPQLSAQQRGDEDVDCGGSRCSQCIKQEATSISNATSALIAAAMHLLSAAKCTSTSQMRAGRYDLQAAYVAGAREAAWNCYTNSKVLIASNLGNVSILAAAVAESLQMPVPVSRSKAVDLFGGGSYTCIATYSAGTSSGQAAAAAAAVTLPKTEINAAPVAQPGLNSTSKPAAAVNETIAVSSADATAANQSQVNVSGGVSAAAANLEPRFVIVRADADPSQVNSSSTSIANETASHDTSSTAANGTAVALNGTATPTNYSDIADTAGVCQKVAYKQPPRGIPAPALEARGAQLITRTGKRPVVIRGINWFGFNVDMGMVDGLWAGGSDAATDFSKIAYQLRLLGFNAVRLPFAHKFLEKTQVWDLVRQCNSMNHLKFKDRLIDPKDANVLTARRNLPPNPSNMANTKPGMCNTYLPTRNNHDRLLFVIQKFISLGMYVVLDYQPQGLEQHAHNLNQFVHAWAYLWRKVMCLPNFNSDIAGRVFIDVMNEPDSMGIRWEASGDRPGAEQLYLATADALWKMSPGKMLFMFEGTGQNMFGLNWGNGFITDQQIINSRGLSNPTSFFQKLVHKPYAHKSIISPHLYPPAITKSTWLGADLWKQSNTSFGYLQSQGFCPNGPKGRCIKFPVVVGETGSAFKEQNDKQWLLDFADFAMARGGARVYNKIPIAGWLWWAYNENSGDTGGIVMNNWQDLNWTKLRYMVERLGLRPWYKMGSSSMGWLSEPDSQAVEDDSADDSDSRSNHDDSAKHGKSRRNRRNRHRRSRHRARHNSRTVEESDQLADAVRMSSNVTAAAVGNATAANATASKSNFTAPAPVTDAAAVLPLKGSTPIAAAANTTAGALLTANITTTAVLNAKGLLPLNATGSLPPNVNATVAVLVGAELGLPLKGTATAAALPIVESKADVAVIDAVV